MQRQAAQQQQYMVWVGAPGDGQLLQPNCISCKLMCLQLTSTADMKCSSSAGPRNSYCIQSHKYCASGAATYKPAACLVLFCNCRLLVVFHMTVKGPSWILLLTILALALSLHWAQQPRWSSASMQ
jgi:hypothetical protein